MNKINFRSNPTKGLNKLLKMIIRGLFNSYQAQPQPPKSPKKRGGGIGVAAVICIIIGSLIIGSVLGVSVIYSLIIPDLTTDRQYGFSSGASEYCRLDKFRIC